MFSPVGSKSCDCVFLICQFKLVVVGSCINEKWIDKNKIAELSKSRIIT